ncbi:unnamed protein product [Ranitomeya imitator]|uniref:(2E,6E)-farnesyl diphosphate synthase n=1 Tax=Ranitomeya imitator TaxID=111125 RepID=A0ABN9MKT0_9NEOB|nr:unnamed protein product [Ranitomeya imitator]
MRGRNSAPSSPGHRLGSGCVEKLQLLPTLCTIFTTCVGMSGRRIATAPYRRLLSDRAGAGGTYHCACRRRCAWQSCSLFCSQTSYQTELGQALDLITAHPGKVDLDRYTESRYKSIVKYKTAFYSFYLPVAAAMYMAGIDSEDDHQNAKTILLEIGEFSQIQDDYLDCYGDPSITGKIGTDIQDNKCGWLVVEALKRVTPEQRDILKENYGQDDTEKVQRVKQLYEELDLSGVYTQYDKDSYHRLQTLISQNANGLSKEIFLGLARKIYKRQK